jgi:hypothetical protein
MAAVCTLLALLVGVLTAGCNLLVWGCARRKAKALQPATLPLPLPQLFNLE